MEETSGNEDQVLFNSSKTQQEINDEQKGKQANLYPMSPIAASATVINLVLATGPFRYAYCTSYRV